MTENEKARELIATSETTVKVDPQNGWYLKRFAALQFEGSVDNFSTNMPIHVLEQQLPKDDTMKLDDAVIEGQDFDYSKFYDERGNEYSSVSELVQTLLDLDDDDSIQEYNEENPDLPYIPYEKLREMDKKDIPELLLSVADEADYVDAYKEVTDIESWNVEVTPMSNNYETMGFAFTHQGLKEYEKSIDNHIFHFCRTYAYAGEQHNRREGDFYPIMEFLHSAGEQLLVDDLKRFDVKVMELATAEEVENLYRTVPNEPHQAAYIKVMDRKTDTVYSRIYVFCAGQEEKCLNGDTYLSNKQHYVLVKKGDASYEVPYPFDCDKTVEALNKKSEKEETLTAAQRLFFWTEYKEHSNDIESLPKGTNKYVKLTVEIDGKCFTGGYEAESIRYCCPHRPDAFINSHGFRYPDEFDRFCEFMNEIGHINSEPVPFSNITEIAAFQGSKIFWKREA